MPSEVKITTAFVLGAGRGTRLRPLTDHCPKPLITLDGRPMIVEALDRLMEVGIRRFIINTHHHAQRYEEAFPDKQWKGIPIDLRHEPELLGTAGGLKNIEDLLGDEEHLLIHNGDVATDLPIQKLIGHHLQTGHAATLALRTKEHPLQVGWNPESGLIGDFNGKLGKPHLQLCLFTGIYIVRKDILRRIQPGVAESIITVFLNMIEEGIPIGGVLLDEGRWCDLGTVESWILEQSRRQMGLEGKIQIEPIIRGGSERRFDRVSAESASWITMHHSDERFENTLYVGLARFLKQFGFPVAEVVRYDETARLAWLQDLGRTDLHAQRHAPWAERRALYARALQHLRTLHNAGLAFLEKHPTPMVEPFDEKLYQWEQNYFFEKFAHAFTHQQPDATAFAELQQLNQRLCAQPPCLIHRDCQSQNILIHNGETYFIDFQGLRQGTRFYDLGSLLFDPYVHFEHEERLELLREYYREEHDGDWDTFLQDFYDASVQRLMQALGAYGFLGWEKKRLWFLEYIEPALRNLRLAVELADNFPYLQTWLHNLQTTKESASE